MKTSPDEYHRLLGDKFLLLFFYLLLLSHSVFTLNYGTKEKIQSLLWVQAQFNPSKCGAKWYLGALLVVRGITYSVLFALLVEYQGTRAINVHAECIRETVLCGQNWNESQLLGDV